ncbi:TPA: AAA family ATPase [Candidatus Micrarchaeota archaeon]|nr:MAG: hypothetical protein AUJ65_01410 [Candidatus Micrarchaeota archaeon CG1_02_51_15]HII39205.1 AAA family ATPase [Candidatus Micrarchaeota archaeon]
MKLVLSGTPCTGKTTLAQELSKQTNWPVIDLNALVKKEGLNLGKQGREYVADLRRLRSRVLKLVKGKEHWIVEGHLACEISLPADVVAVLRADPLLLLKRMKARKYALHKVADNVFCEILDYCLIQSEFNYRHARIIQLDTTRGLSAKHAINRLKSRQSDCVDWSELVHDKRLAFLLRNNTPRDVRKGLKSRRA